MNVRLGESDLWLPWSEAIDRHRPQAELEGLYDHHGNNLLGDSICSYLKMNVKRE